MPDPRVERLEAEIDELRKDISVFIRESTLSFKELRLGIDQVNGHIVDLLTEVGTVPDHRYRQPDRPTVTQRIHKLENDQQASRIANAALESAQASKAQAWTRWQKIALFVIAVVGMVLGILAAIGITN